MLFDFVGSQSSDTSERSSGPVRDCDDDQRSHCATPSKYLEGIAWRRRWLARNRNSDNIGAMLEVEPRNRSIGGLKKDPMLAACGVIISAFSNLIPVCTLQGETVRLASRSQFGFHGLSRQKDAASPFPEL